MELAPFPCGRLPGFRRAISLHPSGCVLLCGPAVYANRRTACTALALIAATQPSTGSETLLRVSATDFEPRPRPGDRAERREREPAQAAADDRQPVRDDGLGPAQATSSSPRCAAATGRRGRHRAPRSRHRAVPRGRPGGLRRDRRVRRRRHRQRGRQRAGRHRHAADLPARRTRERLLPDARDPGRRDRRDRAPAARSPTTGIRARSTSDASATATSCSRRASGSTRASWSASTPTRGSRRGSASTTTPGWRPRRTAAAT